MLNHSDNNLSWRTWELLRHYDWPGNVRELRSMVECLAAKAGGRIITMEHVRREIDAEQEFALTPIDTECFPRLRERETLIDYLCREALAVYERERACLGSHTATADRLGMHRNTLYDWLGWAREHVKSEQSNDGEATPMHKNSG